ncbi:MAG: zinc ribbon domain-containing protein [Leucobacter sp.]
MKATHRQQVLLLDLQQLDHQIARMRKKHEQLPERAEHAALESEREQVKNTYMDAQRELDTRRLELGRIESDVEVVEQRLKRDHELIAVSTSSKEAVSLQAEIDTLNQRKSALEDRELEAMEVAEAAEGVLKDAERVLAGVNERRDAISDRINAAEGEIESERAHVLTEREGIAAEVQGDLLALYETTRAKVGIGAARLNGTVSEASGMALTPAEMSGIRATAPDEIVLCPGTGAILVRDTEPASTPVD